jgi:hypothetical protein
MRRDLAFVGKYSNGTTPKQEKPLAIPKINFDESNRDSLLS